MPAIRKLAPVILLAVAGSLSCSPSPPPIVRAYWEPLITRSTASLRGIHAVDAKVVWATGNKGTVLRTTDGGSSWTAFSLGRELELRDVHAFDERTAFVLAVTRPAVILRTTDGGETWEEMFRHPSEEAFLNSFTFLDRERAILSGDPIDGELQILTSEDGGGTWTPALTIPAAGEGEGGFAASGTCIVSVGESAWIGTGGMASRVLRSTDAGRNWQAAPTPMISGEATSGIYSVAFRDAAHGVLVGGDYTKPDIADRNAAYTADGGETWTPVPTESLPRGQRDAVAWIPGQRDALITVGRLGTDYSIDGGRTWSPLSDEGYYAVSFAPTGEGWAVGVDGRAAKLAYREETK